MYRNAPHLSLIRFRRLRRCWDISRLNSDLSAHFPKVPPSSHRCSSGTFFNCLGLVWFCFCWDRKGKLKALRGLYQFFVCLFIKMGFPWPWPGSVSPAPVALESQVGVLFLELELSVEFIFTEFGSKAAPETSSAAVAIVTGPSRCARDVVLLLELPHQPFLLQVPPHRSHLQRQREPRNGND